jgi:hypothetical protein
MICVFQLPEGVLLEKNGCHFVIILCLCNNLQLITVESCYVKISLVEILIKSQIF